MNRGILKTCVAHVMCEIREENVFLKINITEKFKKNVN